MGIMDLDIFVIGRQSPSLRIWRSYRSGHIMHLEDSLDSVETMCGLPRSLIDVLASIDEESVEEALWLWPGYPGTPLQCQLWEAYRFSAILALRSRPTTSEHSSPGTVPHLARKDISLPITDTIVSRALSSIDAIHNGISKPTAANSLIMNAMLFPLFFITLEVLQNAEYAPWHELVTTWFEEEVSRNPFANAKLTWNLIQDVVERRKAGVDCNAEEMARQQRIEVSLL